jgi:hypothetical protein
LRRAAKSAWLWSAFLVQIDDSERLMASRNCCPMLNSSSDSAWQPLAAVLYGEKKVRSMERRGRD